MSPGKLLYNLFYKPLGYVKLVAKTGVFNYYTTQLAMREMMKQSLLLNEHKQDASLPVYSVYFLTGHKYWYQTAFCLYSLQKACSNIRIQALIIDDGSFTSSLKKQVMTQFPSAQIISKEETEALLDRYLPTSKYPAIRKKRLTYPHIKKLTDIHFLPGDWKMVLDSDMLFFKDPLEITDWLRNPIQPFFLNDPINSYHYTPALMQQLTGNGITENLNVGVVGLKSEDINWDELERWISTMEQMEGTNYLLEQALSAMLVSGKKISVASVKEYVVMPDAAEAKHPTATLHHYVAESKEWYFKHTWKTIA